MIQTLVYAFWVIKTRHTQILCGGLFRLIDYFQGCIMKKLVVFLEYPRFATVLTPFCNFEFSLKFHDFCLIVPKIFFCTIHISLKHLSIWNICAAVEGANFMHLNLKRMRMDNNNCLRSD